MTIAATRLDPQGSAHSLREATVQPSTWNEDDLSVDVCWTTGAAVTRFDWYDGEYYDETLATDPGAVRLDRLQAGGPVLLDHVTNARALAGSIIPGSVQMLNGKGLARIRLAPTDDMKDIVAKVREGHLRTLSVGYVVHTYELSRGSDGAHDRMHAIDWEPHEISLTPVPADAGAVIRTRNHEMPPEIIEATREHPSNGRSRQVASRPVTEAQIRAAARPFDMAFEQELLDEHAETPLTERTLLERINGAYARSIRAPEPIDNNDHRTFSHGAGQAPLARAIGDALYARISGKVPAEHAREFMGASMADMARGLMEARGERVRWESPTRLFARFGTHTTSDFPLALQEATGRYLIDLYQATPSPLKALARRRVVPDFRTITALAMLPVGILREVREAAEFKRTTVAEGANGYKLTTFGEILTLSRQAFINDDLGFFANIAQMWARAAAETEATQLAALITGNGPNMGDGKALYSTEHNNLAASGAAISVASLSAARVAMRSQTNPDGVTPANVVPKYLVVGPAKETEAEQVLAALSAVSQPDQVNPFSGTLQLIVDPRITGNSWRLFAEPSIWPVLEYAQLAGQEGLFTDTRIGFDVDGFDFKARLDFGAGPVDWRGTYKNPGA